MIERITYAECVTAVAAFALATWMGNPWATVALLLGGLFVCGWTSAARAWVLMLGVLCGAFLVSGWAAGREGTSQKRYLGLIERLETVGESVAREFREGDQVPTAEVFRRLEEWSAENDAQDLTMILFDARGRSYAWSGPGLQHTLGPSVPALGLGSRSSFTATSLFAVVPTPAPGPAAVESAGGRVLVGRSFSTLSEPFAANGAFRGQRAMWTLIGSGSETTAEEVVPGWQDFTPVDAPALRVRRGAGRDAVRLRPAFVCLALGFGVLLASRLLSGASGSWATVLLFGVACVAPPGLSPPQRLWVLLALLLVWVGWKSPGLVVGHWAVRGVLGGASVCLVLALAWFHLLPGEELRWEAVPLSLTISGVLLLLGLLGTLRRPGPIRSAPLPWLALGCLGVSLLFFEVPLLVAGCCVSSGVVLGIWAAGTRKFGELCGFAVLSVLVGATVVELAWLDTQRERADQRLDTMAPPTDQGLDESRTNIREFFNGFDLRDFALAEPADLVPQDLAYALWSVSPMSVLDGYSAVLVTTPTGTSSFSFGLPLDPAQGDLDPVSVRWPSLAELPWLDEALVTDLVPVFTGDRAWGDVEYWFASAPNRLHAGSVDLTLLGGNVGQTDATRASLRLSPAGALEGPSELGQLGEWSRVRRTESEEEVWSKSRLILFPEAVLVTAERLAVGVTEAARRVGRRAGVVLASLGAFGGLVLLVGLVRPSVRRSLRRWLGPYSKRMVVVFALLVILPLSTMNLLLLRSVGNRLERERLTRGEAALTSAQIVLSDLLINDEPGFSLDSYIDDELLLWLARVVQHEVSLYFRGSVMASSRPELFAANLLPARIPGEVFSRISLEGERVASRESRVGGVSYRELYASLDLPGVEPGASEVILSVPLLAQQEQATAELRQLATQSLLASAFLLSLVTVVGAALARRFTRPITEMAKGTERIAEGATTMGLDPAEPELAALARAIDRMALRIARGREELLREKRVVEGMVENITSAVVSVGGDGRILLLNRAAVDLFGAAVGDDLSSLLNRGFPQELEDLVSQRPGELRRSTASFVQEDEEHDWTIVWVPVPGTGDPEALLVVEEVSDVLKGQRLAAWAEMARMIAHEIKNPLTPIRLSAEHLHRVWRTRPEEVGAVLDRCLGNILEQVDVLQQTASDFSVYSRIPQALFEVQDLVAASREVVEAYQLSCPPGIDVLFDSSVPELQARFDVKLLSRGIRNLVENAVKASEGGGKVEVLVRETENTVSIVVLDRGPGVPPEDLRRIFEPYFSTSTGGTGLGLPIVREAVEQHGGEVTASNRDRGLRVVIELPRGPGSLLGDV